MAQLSQLFPKQILLSYGCPDRLVIRGYYPALQREANIEHLFHDVMSVPVIDSAALASRTEAYRKWLDRFIRDNKIERIPAPKGERKEDLVQKYYKRVGEHEGIACILTSMESGRTFVSYMPRYKTRDPNYRILSPCWKRFQHLYFYVFDPLMGPMSICVGTYLPFTLQFYLNGHSFVARQLAAQGVGFRKRDNALLSVDDVSALRDAVSALTPEIISQRCHYWAMRLAPQFTRAERRAANLLRYSFSIAQAEYSYDTIFRRRVPLEQLMRRLAELGAFLGGADRTVVAFGRRINRRYQGKLMTVLEGTDQGHPALRSYYQSSYVKLYAKPDQRNHDRCLRSEVCLNDTHHLAVNRGLENLPTLLDKMAATTQRYLDLNADLLDTAIDAGDLAQLASPTIRRKRRIPGIRLHDDRILRLLDVILQPAGLIAGWTVPELHARVLQRYRLNPEEYRPSQLRYDLWKLRAKGIVERIDSSRRYRVTPQGTRLGLVLVKLRFRLLGPLVTIATRARPHPHPAPSTVETAARNVERALDDMLHALGLRAA